MSKALIFLFIFLKLLIIIKSPVLSFEQRLITYEHVRHVNKLFKEKRIKNGYVEFDRYGRLRLSGEYEDENEVDRAFAIAQSVVGPKWVSPITPENIKVREWQKAISSRIAELLSGKKRDAIDRTKPPGPLRNKYALLIGVGKYKEKRIGELQYAENDIKDLYNYLISPNGGGFRPENVIVLVNEKATRNNILNAMNWIKNKAEPDDMVLVYASSHGTEPDKYGGVHLVAYDSEVEPEARIWHTSVTDRDWSINLLEELRAKRVVLILDICYSSGAFAYIRSLSPSGGKSLGVVGIESYSLNKEYIKRITGSKDLVIEESTIIAQADLNRTDSDREDGWGLILISSSSENERSWEDDKTRKSYFTHYLVEGLRKHNGSLRDAFYYAKPNVQSRVPVEKRYPVIDKSTGREILVIPQQTPQYIPVYGSGNIILR